VCGHIHRSLDLVDEAIGFARRFFVHSAESYILFLSANVRAKTDGELRRREPFLEALAIAKELGMEPLEKRCERYLRETDSLSVRSPA
jgi:hypothetical protein